MVSLKVTKTFENVLLAACDRELLGKTFREGKLKLHVTEDFYSGEITTLEEFSKKLAVATIANLVGEKVVGKAIELGFVSKESIIMVQGIPHAQIVRLA